MLCHLKILSARYRLDAAHAACNGILACYMEHADLCSVIKMRAAAQLGAEIAHFDNADNIAVFFAEQCGSAAVLCVLKAHFAHGDIGAVEHCVINGILDCGDLLRGHGLKMREVKSQVICIDKRACLMDVITQNRAQSGMQQMRCRMSA